MNIQFMQMVRIHAKRAEIDQALAYVEKFGYQVQTIIYEGEWIWLNAAKRGTRGDVVIGKWIEADERGVEKVQRVDEYVFD